jgi:hypothetical protein
MKLFTFIFAFLFSFAALAGGKFLIEPYQIKGEEKTSYKLGLAVDQNIMGAAFYSGHVSADLDRNEGVEDLSIKNGIRFDLMKLSIEPGIQFSKILGQSYTEEKAYLKISYELW